MRHPSGCEKGSASCHNRLCRQKRSTKDEEAAIRYFADLFAKAQAPKTNESIQDLALLLCRDPLLFRRNVVGWFVRKDDPAAKDRPSLVFGDLALIFFVSLERFGTPGAVPIRDATKSRMPFCPDAEALAELAADNRSDIDPMVIRDLSEEYQRFAEGSAVYQISTMMGEHGSCRHIWGRRGFFCPWARTPALP